MAEDELPKTGSEWHGDPPGTTADAAAAAETLSAGAESLAEAAADPPADPIAENPQKLPPAQALPPFQGFTSLPPQSVAGTVARPDSAGTEASPAATLDLTPAIPGPPATSQSQAPSAGPPGHTAPGFAPPGYPSPGYGWPGYPLPGYPSPGYGWPVGAPDQAQPGYLQTPYGHPSWQPYPGPPSYSGPPPYGAPADGRPGYQAPGPPAQGWPGQNRSAQGWQASQPGPWSVPGAYPPAGWRYPPSYPFAAYAPPGPGPGLQWGSIGVRLAALIIDAMVLVGSVLAVGVLVSVFDRSGSSDNPATTAIALIWWLVALSYHPACWYVFGATVGQKALGLRVAQASNGQSLGIGAVLIRYLIFFVVTLAFPLGIASAVMASNDPFKRAWHDEVARSVVVKQ